MRNIIFSSLSLIIVLASCSPSTTSTPVATNSASTAEIIYPTLPYTSTPQLQNTIAPTAIETLTPISTPWAFKSLASPDGAFVANAYFENDHPSGVQTIEICDKDGKLIWQIPYQGKLPTGDPHPLLDIFQWSNDSSHLYFYYVWSPDGGDRAFWWTGYNLQKIDMKTGKIQSVLKGKDFMSFAISPDGTQIAYIREKDQPSVILIRNISTGVEKTAYILNNSGNFVIEGDIRWSPQGNGIAFQTQDSDYMVQTIYLNIRTMKQKVIQKYQVYTFDFQGWTNDGKLEFKELEKTGVQIIQIDVITGASVVIGTPTPSP